jgi:hypothetical protein
MDNPMKQREAEEILREAGGYRAKVLLRIPKTRGSTRQVAKPPAALADHRAPHTCPSTAQCAH